MAYRSPYRSEPIDPFLFWVKIFLILLNLLIFSPYIYLVLQLMVPDLLTFWVQD